MRLVVLLPLLLLAGCVLPPVNRAPEPPLQVTPIEIERYLGVWYEIARYEAWFERDCEGVTAEYRARPDGRIDVINTCRKGAVDGPVDVSEGVARIVDPVSNAKLKIRFGLSPVSGDYWVLDRADDYAWALVGEPRGRFLWILSRTPTISPELRADLLNRLQARGYNTDALYWPQQPPA